MAHALYVAVKFKSLLKIQKIKQTTGCLFFMINFVLNYCEQLNARKTGCNKTTTQNVPRDRNKRNPNGNTLIRN